MATRSLEERMTAMEQELALLKQTLQTDKPQETIPWWQQISGAFKDCPEFDEAMRLGRKWRTSQRMEYEEDAPKVTEEDHGTAGRGSHDDAGEGRSGS